MTDNTIKYSIPIYTEKSCLGQFRGIEICENEIRILFNTAKDEVAVVKDVIKIDKTPKIIRFD